MSETMTLYAPPSAELDYASIERSEAEAIRKEHLGHEASVRAVGVLYYLSTILLGFTGVASLLVAFDGSLDDGGFTLGLAAFYIALAAGFAALGSGLRKLRAWVKIPVAILACIGLLGFPLGTLINGYVLYLLFSKKGTMVFSKEYQDIKAETPHLKYKTSIVVWIALAFIAALIGAAVVVPMFS